MADGRGLWGIGGCVVSVSVAERVKLNRAATGRDGDHVGAV